MLYKSLNHSIFSKDDFKNGIKSFNIVIVIIKQTKTIFSVMILCFVLFKKQVHVQYVHYILKNVPQHIKVFTLFAKIPRSTVSGHQSSKCAQGQEIHSHFRDIGDTRAMWQCIQAITNYRTAIPACDVNATLPDDFYTQFNSQNNVTTKKLTTSCTRNLEVLQEARHEAR